MASTTMAWLGGASPKRRGRNNVVERVDVDGIHVVQALLGAELVLLSRSHIDLPSETAAMRNENDR
jgi:hypothetical protein